MRKIVGAVFTAAFVVSLAGAAAACPYMGKESKETVKESTSSSTTS